MKIFNIEKWFLFYLGMFICLKVEVESERCIENNLDIWSIHGCLTNKKNIKYGIGYLTYARPKANFFLYTRYIIHVQCTIKWLFNQNEIIIKKTYYIRLIDEATSLETFLEVCTYYTHSWFYKQKKEHYSSTMYSTVCTK